MKALCFVLVFFFIFNLSLPNPTSSLPQAAPKSFIISYIQEVGDCTYKVNITTSCSSPIFTRDEIGILFGDSHGNQIYAPRLDDVASGTFSKCSIDTFHVSGPCADQICYLYLYRDGTDGWVPESVEVSGPNTKAVELYYNNPIPSNTWYGFNFCQYLTPPPPPPSLPQPPPFSSSHQVYHQKGFVYIVLGLLIFAHM